MGCRDKDALRVKLIGNFKFLGLRKVLKKPAVSKVSRTIRASGGGLDPTDHRCFELVELLDGSYHRLSLEDKLLLQGMPASTRFPASSTARQCGELVGNAVPPGLAAVVFSGVKKLLSQ